MRALDLECKINEDLKYYLRAIDSLARLVYEVDISEFDENKLEEEIVMAQYGDDPNVLLRWDGNTSEFSAEISIRPVKDGYYVDEEPSITIKTSLEELFEYPNNIADRLEKKVRERWEKEKKS